MPSLVREIDVDAINAFLKLENPVGISKGQIPHETSALWHVFRSLFGNGLAFKMSPEKRTTGQLKLVLFVNDLFPSLPPGARLSCFTLLHKFIIRAYDVYGYDSFPSFYFESPQNRCSLAFKSSVWVVHSLLKNHFKK